MDIREKLNIPKKFYSDSVAPAIATSVGELIDLLSELPRDLDVESTFEAAVQVKVLVAFNQKERRCWVEISEPDDCPDEDDDCPYEDEDD